MAVECVSFEELSEASVSFRLGTLNEHMHGHWSRVSEGCILRGEFKFTDFQQSLAFVNRVAAFAEEIQHHPDISFGWQYAVIQVQTHSVGALTDADFVIAEFVNEIAHEFNPQEN